jgi:ABC-type dipeptide/oligopeptide/nickel transport system permease component
VTNDVSAKTNPTAVLALILGILLSPVALPLGWFAREQIRRSREKGMRLCVAAMTLGAISIPVWITGGVVFYLWWSTL